MDDEDSTQQPSQEADAGQPRRRRPTVPAQRRLAHHRPPSRRFAPSRTRGNTSDLTRAQQRSIERVQLVGAIVLAALTIGVPLLNKLHVLSTWTAIGVLVVAIAVLTTAAGMIVARIEHITHRELRRRTNRSIRADVITRLDELKKLLRRR